MSVLIVVAHPDDEVLGAGGTMYSLSKKGEEINVCILSAKASARTRRPSDEDLAEDMKSSMDFLGVSRIIEGDFPNIKLNTVPHLELVQFIERAITETKVETIITHHPADLNNDHMQTSIACQAAVRLFQRREDVQPLKEFLFMEVLSATEWGLNTSLNQFRPNTFVEIGKEAVEKKIEALSMYGGVMRPYPHPRSVETITGLAAYRGSQAGCNYAEAFESVMRRII